MKHNRKYNILGWLATSALLLTTACSDNIALDVPQGDISGANTVTFTVQPQLQELGTRTIETGNKSISDGKKADVLIFAIYKKGQDDAGNETWTPDPDFCKGDQTGKGISLGEGQNAINVQSYPITLQFVVTDTLAEYKAAFWAQNSTTMAYGTKDLAEIKVSYKDAMNNDELRDAFCAVSGEFTSKTNNEEVTLRRPLAQINVGTTGWDYEGAAYLRPSATSYTKSTITLNGVVDTYNVLTGKSSGDPQEVTFEYDILPAFINVNENDWKKLSYKPFDDEEYLKVKLYDKNPEYKAYVGWDEFDNYRKDAETKKKYEEGEYPQTEVFKYLSMCYVLVPEAESDTPSTDEPDVPDAAEETGEDNADDDNAANKELGATLSSVEFAFKGIDAKQEGEEVTGDEEEKEFGVAFKVNNVPVQKNWRTNILGNSFFTTAVQFHIDVVPDYMGEYNDNGVTEGDWPGIITGKTYSVQFDGVNTESTTGFFSFNPNKHNFNGKYKGSYNGKSYANGLKMEGDTYIKFSTDSQVKITIVQSTSDTDTKDAIINVDGNDIPITMGDEDTQNTVRVYTLSVGKGEHTIKKGEGAQPGLLYVEVKFPDTKGGIIYEDKDFDKKYPDYRNE